MCKGRVLIKTAEIRSFGCI